MARQSTTPVQFTRSMRKDTGILLTSGRAGVVQLAGYIPLFAGDSCSGKVAFDFQLKEMPKPLRNGVMANVQAWFVPRSSLPYFSGRDEYLAAYAKTPVKTLGQADRAATPYFKTIGVGTGLNAALASEMFERLGLHFSVGSEINSDLIDSFVHVYNFRLAAHSSKLAKKPYCGESVDNALSLPPAFWPSSRFARVVPDYERALVVGSLDLDVLAGRLPVSGFGFLNTPATAPSLPRTQAGTAAAVATTDWVGANTNTYLHKTGTGSAAIPDVWAEMAGASIGVTLADIDKARVVQSFAKLRASYSGNDTNSFENDDAIIAHLMQGISVPEDEFSRPWLLDSQRVPVNFTERFATDGDNLDASVSLGNGGATLSLNVPVQDVGGMIIYTVELLPERIDERMVDEYFLCSDPDHVPNALRDIQRIEPVDFVLNRRIDAKHASPSQLYGYEPMNDKWNRDVTRLGGDFFMSTPGGGWTENRSNVWQTEIVNPTFSGTHYLAPSPFPHDVFSDELADAYELTVRHAVSILGNTQIGDVLAENSDDYDAVTEAGL